MKKYVALFLFILFCSKTPAIENPYVGARALALSDAFIAFPDVWGTFHNQAGLVNIKSISGAVYYSSQFGLKELAQMAGTVIIPTKTGTFGLGYSQFGTGQFKETKLGLAFSKQLGKRISAGIQIDYLASILPENSRAKGCVTFEGGLLYRISEKFDLGVHVFNPLRQGIKSFTEEIKLPTTIRAGGSIYISEYLLLGFEIEKNSEEKTIIKSGAEFLFLENLTIRFGVSGEPFAYTTGIGYKMGKITTDIGFYYHGNLGITPSVSLQFNLK
ncbi:MAG: hypothetical protein HQ541_05135 [Mariniphaga sp.]|nr:hypothetical protein [Mariniphaga sp.]